MYFVVMPRVNRIVSFSTYHIYLYSINCPTVICLPSMCYLSYGETPLVNCGPRSYFHHIAITRLLYSHFLLYSHTSTVFHSIHSYPLFQANRWDWQPYRKLGAKYLVVLCAGSVLQLASKAWTRHPINCLKPSQASKHHLQSYCLLFSWSTYLGFLTEEKLAAIFIKTFSWGFPTGRLFYFINRSHQAFLAPLPGKLLHQLYFPLSTWHHKIASKLFLATLPGKKRKTSARGVFRTHILYFVLSFALFYFYLHHFISKTQKN
jgi:hypothetical protein